MERAVRRLSFGLNPITSPPKVEDEKCLTFSQWIKIMDKSLKSDAKMLDIFERKLQIL